MPLSTVAIRVTKTTWEELEKLRHPRQSIAGVVDELMARLKKYETKESANGAPDHTRIG